MIYYLFTAAAIIVVIGLITSIMIMKKQKDQEYDKGLNATTSKHNIIANPILIAYVLFPLAIVIGAAIFMYFLF